MKRLIPILMALVFSAPALAQQPVIPGYVIQRPNAQQSFVAVEAANGLPVSALAVATCGGQALTAGVPYTLTMDLTGTLCAPGSGGGTAASQVQGNVASGAADSGNPVKVGGYSSVATPTGVASGQRVNGWYSTNGAAVVSAIQFTGVDAVSNGSVSSFALLGGSALNLLGTGSHYFNGTTWDRARGDATNGAQIYGGGTPNAAVPARAVMVGARSGANMQSIIQADTSVPITTAAAATTQIVALSGSTKIYVTAIDFIAAGTTNVTMVYGTGSNCATGQTALTGAYNLTTQSGKALGGGLGPVMIVPAGQALCILNSAAVQVSGSLAYTQF